MSLQILVVDDEPAIRQVLAAQLRKAGYQVEHLGSGQEALDYLARGDVDVVICDLRLPDFDGIEVLRKARAGGIEASFLMITAYASVNTAIEAMKAGAFDYLIKPLRHEDVLHRLSQIADLIELRDENRRLRSLVQERGLQRCVLPSGSMREVERLITKVAATDGTVLVTGESGTGKGMVARSIHQQSRRSGKAFIPVNCGAIPENLLESEFFGHLKGAFTGAERVKKGLFLEADGGTLFLDEVCELPLALQVKLLHAIEDREIRPVGGERGRRVDVRLVAATNQDVEQAVAQGRFREDLYYRLNVLHIHLPPLRARREDLLPLITFMLERESQRMGVQRQLALDPLAEEILLAYEWPGNVRELQNIIARALILADGDRIMVADLPPQVARARSGAAGAAAAWPPGPLEGSLREQVRLFELALIQRAIGENRGDRHAAARQLEIGLSTLYRKLEESRGAPVATRASD
jgi:two-component system response regulator AtoC